MYKFSHFFKNFPKEGDLRIIKSNSQFSFFLRYTKDELKDQQVELILKDTSKYIMEIFEDENYSISKKIMLPMVDKLGFTTVHSCSLKKIAKEEYLGQYLVLKINMEKQSSQKTQIIFNKQGDLLGHNSTAIQLFNLGDHKLKFKKMNDLFWDFENELHNVFQFFEEREVYDGEIKVQEFKGKFLLKKKINYSVEKILDRKFYLMEMWKYQPKDHYDRSIFKSIENFKSYAELQKSARVSTHVDEKFNFKITRDLRITGSFTQNEFERLTSIKSQKFDSGVMKSQKFDSGVMKSQKYISIYIENSKTGGLEGELNIIEEEGKNYAEGIRVKRLVGDMIRDIGDEDDSSFMSISDKSDNSPKKSWRQKLFAKKVRIKGEEKMKKIRTKKKLVELIEKLKFKYTSKNLNFFYYLFILFSVFTGIVFLFLNNNFRQDFSTIIAIGQVVKYNAVRSNNLQAIHSLLVDISLINSGLNLATNSKNPKMSLDEYRTSCFEDFKFHVNQCKEFSKLFDDGFLGVGQEQRKEYLLIRDIRNITMKVKGEEFTKVSFNQGIEQILTTSHEVIMGGVEKINSNEDDVAFITYNTFKDIHLQIRALSRLAERVILATIDNQKTSAEVSQVAYSIAALISIVFLSFSIQYYYLEKEALVENFYEFEENYIMKKKLHAEKFKVLLECELEQTDFVTSQEKDDLEEFILAREENEKGMFYDGHLILRTKKKKGTLRSFFNCFQFLTFLSIFTNAALALYEVRSNVDIIDSRMGMMNDFKISLTGLPFGTAYVNNLGNFIINSKSPLGRMPAYESGIWKFGNLMSRVNYC